MSERKKISIATFNVRGINSNIKKHQLDQDLIKYKIDIICLQETKIREGVDINLQNSRLITLPCENQYYGSGFLVRNSWKEGIHRVWKVSERLSVLQLKNADNKILSIINAYGPTSTITKEKPEVQEEFLEQLEQTLKEAEKKSEESESN